MENGFPLFYLVRILSSCKTSGRNGLDPCFQVDLLMPTSLISPSIKYFALLVLAVFLYSTGSGESAANGRETPVVKAVARVRASVVNIRGEKELNAEITNQLNNADFNRRVKGMGTGVIIDSRGYIVTNFHVVESVKDIQVTTCDGGAFVARIVARDRATDLAIIKIDSPAPLQTIPVGVSEELNIGESVIAVGNAYGYEHTVTMGIVSALHRSVQASEVQSYENLIQTDASINPGNSGGPLLNIDGEMIGINVAVRAGAQGIGFAIPVDNALEVIADLLERQSEELAWHGLQLETESLANGRHVVAVANIDSRSPGEDSGLQRGDIIHSIAGQEIQNRVDFECALYEAQPGIEVEMEIVRDNQPYRVSLVLKSPAGLETVQQQQIWNTMGVQLSPIPTEEFLSAYKGKYRGGLRVTRVRTESPAQAQGIEPGDVLIGLHKWETVSEENVSYVLNHPDFASFSPLRFLVIRKSSVLYGNLTFPSAPVSVPAPASVAATANLSAVNSASTAR